ncbi:ORF07R [Marbled eel polyomavirus]|uniref:ORF07R n=1 Tax=Marbled eel polyomavirus TaxID=1662286 RepID=UPI0007C1EA63|nr:ORF07R [Marbled eel polyomavirus]ANC70188.1 ORF07R [Marbled eel polyomavirus]
MDGARRHGGGVGPWMRGAGGGPYWDSSAAAQKWLSRQAGKRGWKNRRRGGGLNIKQLASKAWQGIRNNLIPLISRHARSFLSQAAEHAVQNGPQYYSAFKQGGVQGLRDSVLDNLPGMAGSFIRSVAKTGRGSGPHCATIGQMLLSARPHIQSVTLPMPSHLRSEGLNRAYAKMARGESLNPYSQDDCAAPFLAVQDCALREAVKHMNPEERGGFLPLLIPLLGGAISSLVGSIPKFVELAQANKRGKGSDLLGMFSPPPFTSSGHSPRGAGPRASTFLTAQFENGATVQMSRRKSEETPYKIIVKKEGGGSRGRPRQLTWYASADLF